MDKLYWAMEYIRVFVAYFFILYLWPSVVFKDYLKKKTSRTFKFAFCTVVQPVLINTVVSGLGLIGLLKPFVFNILFYGTFLYFLLRDFRIKRRNIRRFKHMVGGTYGLRSGLADVKKRLKKAFRNYKNIFLNYMKGHWCEYSILFVLLVFGGIYFSLNSFQQNSYGFGDLYTHHSWIYQIAEGKIFPTGIYPEAMHCLIVAEHFSFGISVYNALLFTGPVFSLIILISIYIMFRTLFKWKWSPMLALALILCVDVRCLLSATSFARWQWTMPQEYAFPAMFLCLAYLIRFFKNGKKYEKSKIPVFLRDDDLLIFTFAVAMTLVAHFYATLMAVLLCLAGAVILIFRAFSRKFLSFLLACIVGLFIAVLPMLVALAEGNHFQGSLRWALSLMLSEEQLNSISIFDNGQPPAEGNNKDNAQNRDEKEETETDSNIQETKTPVRVNTAKPKEPIPRKLNRIFNATYSGMNGKERGELYVNMTLIGLFIWVIVRIYVFAKRRGNDEYRFEGHQFDGYIVIALASVIFTLAFSMGSLGLPQIIEQYRVCSVAQIMCLALLVIPVDVIGAFILDFFGKPAGNVAAFILVAGIYVGARITGNFHGYLMIELTRYNSAVQVTNSITEKMGKGANNFTVVSSTDELYPVLGYGYHEELISFINNSEQGSYEIPTEYIFIYIEKNVIARAQYHLASGPSWLAEDKYSGYYVNSGRVSIQPDIVKETISPDYANLYFGKFPEVFAVYNTLWMRTILNSKAFVWCQRFNAMYPNELHTFYEDDDILIYYLRQNPRNLYELSTMDPSFMIPPENYGKPIWPENYKEKMGQ